MIDLLINQSDLHLDTRFNSVDIHFNKVGDNKDIHDDTRCDTVHCGYCNEVDAEYVLRGHVSLLIDD